ncbi:MAG: integrase family protein [Pseudomonadota bacterium]|nr:integrase family protein [Pseudomonadota bacterium]
MAETKTARVLLTAKRVELFTCPPNKSQAFLWDTNTPTMALRATRTGRKTYVFEARLKGQTIRTAIGSPADWTLDMARLRAAEQKRLVDDGLDPREVAEEKAEARAAAVAAKQAATEAAAAEVAARALTVGEAWTRYIEERRPHWGERNYADHLKLAQLGGKARLRRPDVMTKPGPLAALMPMRLADLNASAVEAWVSKEASEPVARLARLRLALRLLKAFLRWAASEPDLKDRADPAAASAKKAREAVGKAKAKNDYLQREQLRTWFEHVRKIGNPVISAYLQCLLLTGARREELAELRWDDVNTQWCGIDLKDKIEGRRAVPLTPYVADLIASLPRRNEWVFSSARAINLDGKNAARRARYHAAKGTEAPAGDVAFASASGRLVEPSIAHRQACTAAGLDGLTLHGLRRSFASLCEWLDIPGGISAQIQGHAPQGVREQNYIRRPLDLLRVHHEKIEAWMLAEAGVPFDAKASRGGLKAVSNAA